MCGMFRRIAVVLACLAALAACSPAAPPPPTYDLVIANGRVMDPASGLDGVRHVGITGGRIEAISETPLQGTRVVDAANHVVAPGFIDLHEHGQQDESYRMMVRDGVTSAFELEVGTGDVAAWYEARKAGQIVNYGVAAGHIPARMRVLKDPGQGLLPAGVGGSGTANDAQIAEMEAIVEKGLREGAVAVGLGSAYTPGAPMSEIQRIFKVAAAAGAAAHIHMRGDVTGLHETIAAAKAAGAALHIVHVNSVAGDQIDQFLAAIQAARDAGQDVTTEAYPYGAGMTEVQSALFDDWKTWPDEKFQLHQLVRTGERLTRKTFEQARKEGGTIIIHGRSDEQTRKAIVEPALDDRKRRLHRERPRASAHLGQLRQDAREVRAGREGHDAHGRARAHDGHAGAPARSAGARHGAQGAPHRGRRRRRDDLRPGHRDRPLDL